MDGLYGKTNENGWFGGTPISENLHMGESIPTYSFFSMEMGQKPFKTCKVKYVNL